MTMDVKRAAEALRQGRLDEAELHAWNALLTVGPDDVEELRRVVNALDSTSLKTAFETRWGTVAGRPTIPVKRRLRRTRLVLALVFLVVGVGSKVAGLANESGPVAATREAIAEHPNSEPTLIGNDGIWLVPLGRLETIDLGRLARELSSAYKVWVGPVELLTLPSWTLDPNEKQLSAEALVNLLNKKYRSYGQPTVVGITDYDMRSRSGPYSFALRAEVQNGVVSTSRLGADLVDRLRGHTRYERVRKLVKRQIELQRNGGTPTDDPHSLLQLELHGIDELDRIDE